jgi:hypothetical protein
MARNILFFFFFFCLFVASSFNHQTPKKEIHGNQKNQKKREATAAAFDMFCALIPPLACSDSFLVLDIVRPFRTCFAGYDPERERKRKRSFGAAVYLGWRECRSAVKESE